MMFKKQDDKGVLIKLVSLVVATFMMSFSNAQTVVFDDFEHGDPIFVGWFAFGSAIGGGIDPNGADLAPIPGNAVGMQTGWGSGAGPGFWGGFGWENPIDLGDTNTFTFWINPDPGQDYILEINIQDDDNGDGLIDSPNDDEFQFNCAISADGPCAIAGGGWQKVEIPLSDFFDDNSFLTGGDGILNAQSTANGGNGELRFMVMAVVSNSPEAVTFRTDQWQFETQEGSDADGDGITDDVDNCTEVANPNQVDADADGFGNRCDADFNDDCSVNFIDIAQFAPQFLGVDPEFNLDSIGSVNFLDFSIVTSYFLLQPGPSALASCP